MEEKLRLVAELDNRASRGVKQLTKDMGAVKPTGGMVAAHRWMNDFRAAGQKAAEATRPVTGALSALGVGGIAASLSLGEMVRQFRDLAAEIPKLKELGRESGISETQIKRLAYAARLLNADGDKMGAAIGNWSEMMLQFRQHSGTTYNEMLRNNASLAQKMASEGPAEAFKDWLGWLARIPAAAQAAGRSSADAAQIQKHWLREGAGSDDLMPMLAKGAQGLADAYADAAQNVTPITPELEKQAEALNRSLTRFDQTWHNFKTEIGPSILDPLTKVVDKLDQAFKLAKANPAETAVGAGIAVGGAAALYARNRIMRGSQTFGLRDAATKHLEAAAALKGAAASLAGRGGSGAPGGAPGANDKGTPSLGSRVVGFGLGLAGIVANAPSADASDNEERQANHDAIESLGQTIENALHLPQLRERIYGSAKPRGEDDREGRARASDMLPTSSTAKKDTADAIKAGTLAAWREIAQQQDLGSGTGRGAGDVGHGLPNMRYGRGAGGGYRHTLGKNYDLSEGGTGSNLPIVGSAFNMKAPGIAARLKQDFPDLGDDDAAAILGNLGHESAGFKAFNEGGGGPGRGWAQWTDPGRKARFFEYAKVHNLDPKSDDANYGFLRWELQHTHKAAIEALKRSKGLRDKTRAFEGVFEGAGVKAYGSRDRYADAALSAIQGAKLKRHANGGMISGPGGPRSDSIFARVSNGEFVVNAKAAGQHLGLLQAINDGRAPAFADGGRVGSWLGFFRRSQRDGGMGARLGVARAAVAMMQGESGRGMNPNLYGWDVNGPSGGTAQWHDVTKGRNAGKVHRLTDLMAFAMNQHADWRDLGIQQAWWKHEALGPLRGAWKAMAGAHSATAALRAGINRFEVPADKQGEFMKRLPNLVRLARQDAGGSAALAEQQRMQGELHVHLHDGRPAKVVAKNQRGLKVNIRSNPTMVEASRF